MTKEGLALLAAAATGVQVGVSMVASRAVANHVDPATLALLRYAVGAACSVLYRPHLGRHAPLAVGAIAMLASALALAPAALIWGRPTTLDASGRIAVAGLGIASGVFVLAMVVLARTCGSGSGDGVPRVGPTGRGVGRCRVARRVAGPGNVARHDRRGDRLAPCHAGLSRATIRP